jgi:prepilin-type N-terminal cleavage/methylation domain-containing protein
LLQDKKQNRNSRGYSLLELMVAISLIGVVAGMLYMYQNRGWNIFNKSLSFAKLQIDARASLEQLSRNLKRCSKDLIYVDSAFNSRVPLPEDAIYGKPYIYFAMPQKQTYKARAVRSKENTVFTPPYDFYLYYIAYAKDREGLFLQDRALLRMLVIKNQDGDDTLDRSSEWPFMPDEYYGAAKVEAVNGTIVTGLPSNIQLQTESNEFELYESYFNFGFFNTGAFENLFRIRVKLVDTKTDTKVEYETAINPRN